MKAFKICSLLLLSAVTFISCKKEENFKRPEMTELEEIMANSVEGNWTEFTPFNADKPKSFSLEENGNASSTNIVNNEYKHWWISIHSLYILSKNADNNSDTLIFPLKAISENTLVLERNNQEFTYKRVIDK